MSCMCMCVTKASIRITYKQYLKIMHLVHSFVKRTGSYQNGSLAPVLLDFPFQSPFGS